MPKKVLFVGAKAFAGTGGIEQVNKSWMFGLSQQPAVELKSLLLADDTADARYTQNTFFKGYRSNKLLFLWDYFRYALNAEVLIVSHVQLAILIPLLKIIKPTLNTIVICHGIEVWAKLNVFQRRSLQIANQILAVSRFTKEKLVELHQAKERRVLVFPNALDPFFPIPKQFERPRRLAGRYQVSENDTVLLTIARLSSAERYKGCDFVMEAIPQLKKEGLSIKYIIGGKADEDEKIRLEKLIAVNGLQQEVILTGFIPDEELIEHYQLANVFIMPSTGEGFGISFIESAACGTPVLGGNTDGSPDAIIEGETGFTCTPKNPSEIAKGIRKLLAMNKKPGHIQNNALKNYSFALYQQRIADLIAKHLR